MKNISVLRAGVKEISGVAKLFDLYRQFYEQKTDIILAEEFITHKITHNESVILVAINQEEEMLGFCQMYPSYCSVIASPIYVLYDLFTLPNKRKLGVGKSLLMAAEKQCKSAGVTRMDLTTAKTNFAAQSLYESLGWEKDDVFFTYNKNVKT